MVSQHQTKDSGSKKNGGKELGMVAPQDKSSKEMKSSKKMKFASSSAETEPTSQTTISDDSKTGRGMRKLQKLRPIVEYNKRGKGIGQAHSEMQSYIGVLARSSVPLVDKKWSQIPKDIKEQIWEAVDMAFVVGQGGKNSVLASAAKKWKDFKSTLTRHYILPYTNDKEKLSQPLETYKFIEKAQWDAFVASRLSKDFESVHSQHAQIREKLEQDKHGNIPDPKVAEKAKLIDELQKQVSEGKVNVYGSNDVLTMALGPGRLRGVGAGISPRQYFNLPKPQRVSFDDRLKESLRVLLQEETKKMEAKAREEALRMEARTKQLVEAEREHFLSQLSQLIPNFDPSMLKSKISQSPKNPMSDKASCSGGDVSSLHFEDDTAKNGKHQQDEEKEEEKRDEEKEEEKEKEDEEKHDDKVIEVGDYSNMEAPSSLKTLCRYVETTLLPEDKILQFTIDKEVFGGERYTFLLPEDITQFAGMEEIGATVLAVYMRDHVYFNGIGQSYKNWTFHGEPWEATTNASRNVEEDDGHSRYSFVSEEIDMDDNDFGDFGSDPYEFANVIGDGDQPVYPGCRKYTKLSALVKLYNLKAKHGMSDVCFTELLILQGDLLPEGNTIPTSMYEAKKTLCALGLSYEKMHACPNDCILYRKEYEDSTNCPTCGISRWKEGKDSILKEGVPAKVVWYFPPIPRFKRMFQSHETAKSLTWHAARKSIDGQMSHPADSPSWKLLDDKWPEFGNEPRNLRLALSSDGFNPHSSLSSRYSCWPVILVTYNLPLWLCMKQKFMMLTLLISGPKQPGNDIDVYLEPLIDDLKSLWVGIRGVYDAHNGEYFTLRAALMWTINDFPAYGNLSGCVVKGYKACPICGDDTPSHRLKNGHKICYIGHRKWLPINHPYRRQHAAFNGKPEYGIPPEPLTGEEVLHMVENGDRVCWKKKSIFFDLEYWKYLPVRHSLDVMHIEKNVCDSIIGTLLEIPGKNKDGIAARLDLLNMGVKTGLQPKYGERRTRLPPGPWNLSRAEKREVCNSFYGMKVPEGYSSNIKNLVSLQDSRLLGLKSHDCHTLMQQLLLVEIRSVLEKPARYMKVLKGYVQNHTRPEGCIAERYIAEEAVEFCTQHLSGVSTVGVPSNQKMGVSKPLSGCTVSVVDQDLLNQAHLYVLENTEEVLPYIEQHMIHIKTVYPKFR
ncbi:hypothetical protein L3X38_010689 [Prunus dulcis]|uniref:DUF4218 domain-containing protein n=1 Tax=Prunus dulcis TaxID=3755 RepID=A0AAD4WG04_PRUDU|nr:hypothetical protein L3X38_010689 [Prunus dulcis]